MRLAPAEQKNNIIHVDRMKEISGIDVPKVRFCFKYMLAFALGLCSFLLYFFAINIDVLI